MTIGIYLLKFKGTSHVYIGQSLTIEDRYKEHLSDMRNDHCSDKLAAAYFLFGVPELYILEECSAEELNEKELYYINEANAIRAGLNTLNGATPRNFSKQIMPKQSKYSEAQYYSVLVECINNPMYAPKKIAEITNTDSITVSKLRNFKSFTWLEYRYPEEYAKLRNIRAIPPRTYTPVIEKKIEYYPDIVSPEGEIFKLARGDVRSFAKENGISYTALNKVLNNKLEHTGGWRLSLA
jgi:group I intron endonuclease